MAEGVNIPIRATLQGNGLQQAAAGNDALQKELAQTQQELKETTKVAAQTDSALNDHGKALKSTADASDAAAKKGGNFANAMLQGSRGVQDFAAAGIPGMVNNVEGLATALGLGASAAGGLTLALVAVEVLMKNWDTWFGEEKVKQAASFWSAMTPDEAQMTRLREANEALENQAKNLERIAEIRKADIQSQREEDAMLAKKAALWKDLTPTPEQRGDLPALPGTEPETPAMKEAKRKLAEKEAETQAKVGTFQGLDAATEAQRKRVEDMNRVATLPERVKLANYTDSGELAKLDTSFDDSGAPNSPAQMEQAEIIRRRMKQRADDMRAQLSAVPGLTDGLTGDPEKDKEALQAKAAQERERLAQLEAQRLQAARDAEAAARAQAQAEQGVTGQQQVQAETTAARGFGAIGLPPAPGQFAGADAQGGLTEALARLNEGQAQSRVAAQQVTQAADAVVTESTQLGQKTTGALSTLAATLRNTTSQLAALEAEFNSYRDSNR